MVVLTLLAAYTHIGASRTEQAYPTAGAFARIDGLRVHYESVGTGPAIVLIHGARTSLRDFDASILEPLRTLAYPLGTLALDGAVARVFDPDPVPHDYTQRSGIRLSLRPKAFLANAQDISRLSDFLATQIRRYGDIRRPLLMITGGEDSIVPSWNHADRLIEQVAYAEWVDLETTGHAMHHAYPMRMVDLIKAFSDRLRATTDRAAVEARGRDAGAAVAGARS